MEHHGSTNSKTNFFLSTISDAESFFSMSEEWDNLLFDSTADTIFLTSDWLSTWWHVFGHNYQMHVILIRDSTARLVAAAPLMFSETTLPLVKFRLRALRFIGYGDDVTPEYLSLVIRQGYENDVLPSLVAAIVRNDAFNFIDFKPVAHNNLIFESLIRALAASRFNYKLERFSKCPILRLPSSWASLVANSSKNFKKKSKEYLRVAQRDLHIQFRRVEDETDLQNSMNQLAELHRNRWGDQSRAFRSKGYFTFHNALAQKLLRQKRLRLHFIEQAGKPLAAFYGFHYNERYYYYQSGRNLAYARYHLGYVLMNHCIQEAIEEGASIFDFLTGAEKYKYHWANDCEHNYQLSAYRDRNAWCIHRLLNIFGGAINTTRVT